MKVTRWLKEIFSPENIQNLHMDEIANALNDHDIRTVWLASVMNDLKLMNLEIDKRLISGSDYRITDLCARRRAYQDILEGILQSAISVKAKKPQHNPRPVVGIDLDRVTG